MVKEEFVSITWYDACDHNDNTREEVLASKPKNWLYERTTHGLLLAEDNKAILLVRDEGVDGLVEITAIPKEWVKKIVRRN